MAMTDRIQAVFEDVLELDSVDLRDETSPKTVPEWDSIANVRLMAALEREFGVSLGLEDIMAIDNVGDIRRVLAAKGVPA